MNVVDYIELISSVIGIIAAIWVVITYIFKPYLKRKEELSEIKELIDFEFIRWKEFGLTSRAETYILGEKFKRVDKYRNHLKNISTEKLLYLFRCSLQSGMQGNWGKWLNIIPFSKDLIFLLINCLEEKNNLRPTWRCAFILENILNGQYSLIDNIMKDKIELNDITNAIRTQRVREYLQNTSQITKDESLKSKINLLLQEIEYFGNDIRKYSKNIAQGNLEIIISSFKSNHKSYNMKNDIIVSVHLEEYKSLMNEMHKRMEFQERTISYTILILAAFVTVLSAHQTNLLILAGPLIFYALGLIYAFNDHSIVNIARYINKIMRPKLIELLGNDSILSYENYIYEQRIVFRKTIIGIISNFIQSIFPIFIPILIMIYFFHVNPEFTLLTKFEQYSFEHYSFIGDMFLGVLTVVIRVTSWNLDYKSITKI